jgi:UDP-N-acetyl-alpha-D-muramoyl-L-alanyl-L-glutamate epimerase
MTARGAVFRYEFFRTDAERGLLTSHYSLDGRGFTEQVTLPPGPVWDTPAAQAAARLVFLLSGVSYYKTAAPPVIDLGDTTLTPREEEFLRDFYLNGLAEFAYRNALSLIPLEIRTPTSPLEHADGANGTPDPLPDGAIGTQDGDPLDPSARSGGLVRGGRGAGRASRRALVPFGGGIDSIVTVEQTRERADVALFVVSRPGDTYDAIERPMAVTGLPVVRAERGIDPQLLHGAGFAWASGRGAGFAGASGRGAGFAWASGRGVENGFLNGHVPVTGIISAIAVLAAVLDDRDAVVMSNEWSASIPTLEFEGKPVNHQYSKSAAFEAGFRDVLANTPATMPDYFSWLRDRTELWVGREFAALEKYHGTFCSCNKAFYSDRNRRFDHWCGQCDKCCFIDLILAPFLPKAALRDVFAATGDPLADPRLRDKFRALLGAGAKPFECVGEVTECRAAALLAARRQDRQDPEDDRLLQELAAEVRQWPDAPDDADAQTLLKPVGESFVPAGYR